MGIHFHISREKCNFEGYKTKTNTTIQPIETMNITRSLFLFVFTLVLACQAKAKEVYIDFSAQGFSNAAEVFNVTSDGVTIIFSQGTGSYPTRYYDNGKALRIYGGNYFQVSAGTTISSIKMRAMHRPAAISWRTAVPPLQAARQHGTGLPPLSLSEIRTQADTGN